MRLVTGVAVAAVFLALAGPVQAARVDDGRDMPANLPDVKQVGAWYNGGRTPTVVVKFHEPVPQFWGGVLSMRLGPRCGSGDLLRLSLAWDQRYGDLFSGDEVIGGAEPLFENHRTTTFRVSPVGGRNWRCASEIV